MSHCVPGGLELQDLDLVVEKAALEASSAWLLAEVKELSQKMQMHK